MLPAIIAVAVVAVHVVLLVLIFVSLARAPGAAPDEEGGRRVLRPSKAICWSSAVLALWSLGGVALVVYGLIRGEAVGAMAGVPLALTAGLGAAWGFARHARHRIAWDAETVEVTDWRGRVRQYRWADLSAMPSRSPGTYRGTRAEGVSREFMRALELHFGDGEQVRTAPNMIGYRSFVDAAMEVAKARGFHR